MAGRPTSLIHDQMRRLHGIEPDHWDNLVLARSLDKHLERRYGVSVTDEAPSTASSTEIDSAYRQLQIDLSQAYKKGRW